MGMMRVSANVMSHVGWTKLDKKLDLDPVLLTVPEDAFFKNLVVNIFNG